MGSWSFVPFDEPSALAREALAGFPPALAARARAKWLKTANRPSRNLKHNPNMRRGVYDRCESEANDEVLRVAAALKQKWVLPIDCNAGDEEIVARAEALARFVVRWWDRVEGVLLRERLGDVVRAGSDAWDVYADGVRAEKLVELAGICRGRGVDVSDLLAKLAKGKDISLSGIVKRLSDEGFCRTRLRRAFVRMREGVLRNDVGEVGAFRGLYVSDDALRSRRGQRRRNAAILEAVKLVNELGEEFKLSELVERSVSNPALRRAELMVRIAGFETVAKDVGHVGEFVTLTCPSAYHARHYKSGKRNEKFNGTTPREAADYLNRVWARIRSELKDAGIVIYGFRVAEPHHDGTPHWHGLFFMAREHVRRFRQIVAKHGCREDREELGLRYFLSKKEMSARAREIQAAQRASAAAGGKVMSLARILGDMDGLLEADFWASADLWRMRKAAPRVEFTHINWKRGTAAGYIAKYIAKNIDGRDVYGESVGVDLEALDGRSVAETAERVDAWAATWGIRQFQQIGGAPVSVWRELRRLDVSSLGEDDTDLVRAAVAADAGDWGRFVMIMGGVDAARADMPLGLYKEDFETVNRYGEPAAPVVRGVVDKMTGVFELSRVHEWTWVKMGGEAAAWTCVNNCRKEKFSPEWAGNLGSDGIRVIDDEGLLVLDWLLCRLKDGDRSVPADLDALTVPQLDQYRREWRNVTAAADAAMVRDGADVARDLDRARADADESRNRSERVWAARDFAARVRRLTKPARAGIVGGAVGLADLPVVEKPSRAVVRKNFDTPDKAVARLRDARAKVAAWLGELEAEAEDFFVDLI